MVASLGTAMVMPLLPEEQAAKPKMQPSARTAARMIDIVFFMLIISFVF